MHIKPITSDERLWPGLLYIARALSISSHTGTQYMCIYIYIVAEQVDGRRLIYDKREKLLTRSFEFLFFFF